MPQVVNTSSLQSTIVDPFASDDRETAITIKNVSMTFNMASEQLNSLKEYAIALAKHELRFKGFTALDDISFEVKKGDVFGIMGTNGSGKSTLLKVIAGVLEPSKGSVDVHGNIAPLIELGAGFDYELTARENIYLNGALLGYSKEFIDQHFEKIVEFAEVAQFLDMPLKNYSSGMVSRIAFAIATVIVPEILIVDEVLSVGDFMFQQKCERRIQELIKEYGVTVLIVSHSTDQIERLCNKAIWIEKSHTRMIGTAHDVCALYRYVGGREGSMEAEQDIVQVVTAPDPAEIAEPETYTSDSKYGISVKLNEHAYQNNECAILVRYDSQHEGFIAADIASVIDAPVYYYESGAIPDATYNSLIKMGVKKALILGPKEQTDLVEARLRSLPDFESSEALTETYIPELCRSIVEKYAGQWGDTAILTRMGRSFDLAPLTGYAIDHKTPIMFVPGNGWTSPGELNVPDALFETLCGQFKHLFVLGGVDGLSPEEAEKFEVRGVSVEVLVEDDWIDRARAIARWVESKRSSFHKEALIVPLFKTENAAAAGLYAFKHHGIIIPEATTHLESISDALSIVSKHAPTIEKVSFVGGAEYFNEDSKHLVMKAVALNKH